MPQLIDHLAELTGFRDRDQLDVSVVRAVNDVIRPLDVGIYRCVGESNSQRWLTRARLREGESAPAADPLWRDFQTLPELHAYAARAQCLSTAEALTEGDGPQTSYFPIATEREVVGVLELVSAEPLSTADRAMLTTVLRIYGNFHDLLDHSERDPLTGLLNRQTFNAALVSRNKRDAAVGEIAQERRAAAEVSSTWLGVIDIDHFKRVNDNFGHPIGDEVLLLLSRLLRSSFRHFDRLYRFGGEEFVVVLDCNDAGLAAHAYDRLRTNVERFNFPQVGRVTVSIGFTQAMPCDTPSAAFARADKALYYVKENGRNRVAQFEELVDSKAIVVAEIAGGIELF